MEKHFELAGKALVQKKLWQNGYRARKIRFSPVDFIAGKPEKVGRYAVKVICIDAKKGNLHIPEDAKYADVVAVVVLFGFIAPKVYWLRLGFSHTEPRVGKTYRIVDEGDLLSKDFVESPDKAFISVPKGVLIPRDRPGLISEEWYSPREISEYRFLGRQLSSKEVKALIASKKLKATIWGTGTGQKTMVKGVWIIEYLSAID